MKTKIYSNTIFLTVFFLLIFLHAGNAQTVADLYEKYSNKSQNQHLKPLSRAALGESASFRLCWRPSQTHRNRMAT